MQYPKSITKLIDGFTKLPGVGPKTAERMAFHVLKMNEDDITQFSNALVEVQSNIIECNTCHHITDKSEDPCYICSDKTREESILCIVEHPKDVIAMEKMQGFNGLYHVLHGSISPIEGIGPEDLKIKSLIERLQKNENIKEVILATNPNIEGETTAMYISRLLQDTGIKVTRIARGLPVGGDLEYADAITLSKALEGRREI